MNLNTTIELSPLVVSAFVRAMKQELERSILIGWDDGRLSAFEKYKRQVVKHKRKRIKI